jgi:hypothetical protein
MRKMKNRLLAVLLVVVLALSSCDKTGKIPEGEELGYDYYAINMNNEYKISDTLEAVDGKAAKVIFLIGQSNATGCSLNSYLKEGVGDEKYKEFEDGYKNVLINFSLDNQDDTSDGAFVPVDLTCGAGEGYFGPELGMAEQLSHAFPDENIFILKFSMSGYTLNYHWLYDYSRASIYNSFITFANTYLAYLESKGYEPSVDAICWMQGESDTTEYKSSKYYKNTECFVSFLRADLAKYGNPSGIYFIDAGISSSPYCLPSYPEINEAKEAYSLVSELNVYFSTIDMGLTTLNEPYENPDLGHYDALSELELGRAFGKEILKMYENSEKSK